MGPRYLNRQFKARIKAHSTPVTPAACFVAAIKVYISGACRALCRVTFFDGAYSCLSPTQLQLNPPGSVPKKE